MFNTKSKTEIAIPAALAEARARLGKLAEGRIRLEGEEGRLRREGAHERAGRDPHRARVRALLPEGLGLALAEPEAPGRERLAEVGAELAAIRDAEGIERGEVERLAGEAALAAAERCKPEVVEAVRESIDGLKRFLASQEKLASIYARFAEAGLPTPANIRCEHAPLARAASVDLRNIEEAARGKGLLA